MKIIGGVAKGRYIRFPAKSRARPTTDRIKGSLFDILSSVTDKRFLDSFAGSGGIGMEALSRGAAFAVFIERDTMLSDCIEKNLLACRFDGKYKIFTMEVNKAVSILQKKNERFDIIFADPPYEEGLVNVAVGCFANKKLFAENGFLVIQHSIREELLQSVGCGFEIFDEKRYGDSILSFVKYR